MSADLTFGPSDQEWHYSQSSKTYDLSGGSPKKLTVAATEGPEDTLLTISPEATALVIIDMQNFFLDGKCMEHPHGLKAVEPTIKVIEKCREAGIQVIWVNWGLNDQDLSTMSAGVMRGFMRDVIQPTTKPIRSYTGLGSDLGDSKGRCLFAGTWNADIYSPLKAHVQDSDLHCAKSRMSALWTPEQPLWKTLKEQKKTTVLFTGVNTDQCVLGTLVDAYNAGWNCILVDDCCGTTTKGAKEVTLSNVAKCYGFVTDSTSLIAAKVG
ncbi:Peroxyureidoacrylate/ureidoacrylate amidohydrolase [Lachnellula occidentalis]|uniref:Peroxyureidoacrylate/ureidoacrylate amidohydrolase n=1 Tax=Lachnellula occidentalis TaxID=215460 RepID=A0A8H8S7P8_9HELO|nr:Peroxyureidoacrylate/ureidoacrylate amidohydrolase [Lachnellula occidentalis]